jgi:ribonucleoside-diphosphate reductase alpha chain
VFHSTVQAYIDKHNLQNKVQDIRNVIELEKVLPPVFFRTSHFISSDSRIMAQAACQKFIDHSISSTVNLPESVEPETISNIYLKAWREGLKGITIYRDGSRFPILSIEQEMSEFAKVKDKEFIVTVGGEEKTLRGDQVFRLPNGKLTTPFHATRLGFDVREKGGKKEKVTTSDDSDKDSSGKACKVKFVNGKLVKECGD